MSCYSIRPTTTSSLPRLLPDPLLDRIDAIQRADPWAHEDALDEGGLDGYADSPPLGGAAARLGFAPPHLAFDDAATPPWPPHAASLARLEQSGLQPSPRVLPGADQVRTPYTQTFRIGPRTILGADTPITIVNRFCLDLLSDSKREADERGGLDARATATASASGSTTRSRRRSRSRRSSRRSRS